LDRARVLLADDSDVFASEIRELLDPAYDVVGVAESGEALEAEFDRLAPDVVVTDIAMPGEGGLVAMPTETVYGLAARADDDAAVAQIFATKGRPADHPLIVHVLGRAEALAFAAELSDAAERLIAAFWPGPVTVIVRRAPGRASAAASTPRAAAALRPPPWADME